MYVCICIYIDIGRDIDIKGRGRTGGPRGPNQDGWVLGGTVSLSGHSPGLRADFLSVGPYCSLGIFPSRKLCSLSLLKSSCLLLPPSRSWGVTLGSCQCPPPTLLCAGEACPRHTLSHVEYVFLFCILCEH